MEGAEKIEICALGDLNCQEWQPEGKWLTTTPQIYHLAEALTLQIKFNEHSTHITNFNNFHQYHKHDFHKKVGTNSGFWHALSTTDAIFSKQICNL